MNAPRATLPPPVPPKTIWSADKTLRDEFAMAALPAFIAREPEYLDMDHAAQWAYMMADAMLEARNANR